jgi:hypothetical protein
LNGDSLADDLPLTPATVGQPFTTPPAVGDSIVAVGSAGGFVYFFRLNGMLIDSAKVFSDAAVTGISAFTDPNSFVVTGSGGSLAVTVRRTSGGTAVPDRIRNFGARIEGPAATGTFANGQICIAFVTGSGVVFLVDAFLNTIPGFPVTVGTGMNAPPALADVNGDGLRDIVVFSGSKIYAFNAGGAALDYFPYTVQAAQPLASAPIVADVDGDGRVEIVAVSGDGLVVAVNREAKMALGFPLKAGRGYQSTAVTTMADTIALVVASSDDGSVSAWKTGTLTGAPVAAHYPWPQYGHDAGHRGIDLTALSGIPISSEFFPKERAYNWPNPVYEGKTHLRYYVRDNATVRIRIFDIAGDLVTSFSGPGIGGIDNEVEWDVSGIQSGVYLARIEANGTSGNGVAVVKVAVVK